MNGTYCFNKKFFILLAITIVILFIFQYIHFIRGNNIFNNNTCQPCNCDNISQETNEKYTETIKEETVVNQELPVLSTPHPPSPMPTDIVRQYDYKQAYDPLQDPTRRIPRYEMTPFQLKRLIDLPTRGYPDNFTQIGVLVKEGNPDRNIENKIIRLFGRQEYPSSNRYEYYTMVNSGNDQIKIPIDTKAKKELYDGDQVFISELDDTYRVQLFKYNSPRYYPDIVF